MSEINELIYKTQSRSFELGRLEERGLLFKLMRDVVVSNDIGEYVYISDLKDVLEAYDEEHQKK